MPLYPAFLALTFELASLADLAFGFALAEAGFFIVSGEVSRNVTMFMILVKIQQF